MLVKIIILKIYNRNGIIMKKDLSYYMSLPYKVDVLEIVEEDGGGYEARIPQLRKWTMVACGESVDEAIRNLDEVKITFFEKWIEEGFNIPEPDNND